MRPPPARQASLPDLLSGRARPAVQSTAEAFVGARPSSAIASTRRILPPRPGLAQVAERRPASALLQRRLRPASVPATPGEQGFQASSAIAAAPPPPPDLKVSLIAYTRLRQQWLDLNKTGRRAPRRPRRRQLEMELRQQDQTVAREVRALNPLFFQRFDATQLERFLRALPILRVPEDRWIYGDECLRAQWPPAEGERAFLLLNGCVALHADAMGASFPESVGAGTIFGEGDIWLGDEMLQERVAGCVKAEESCMVGVLTTQLLQTAFADRAFGNRRIVQTVQRVPSFARISNPEATSFDPLTDEPQEATEQASHTVLHCLHELSTFATTVHVEQGRELLLVEHTDDNIYVVASGAMEVRADIRFVENFDNLTPIKARLNVVVHSAESLPGDSWSEKLSPYVVAKFGESKRFQSPAVVGAGRSPKWEYQGAFVYEAEQTVEFAVMSRLALASDDLCGAGTLDASVIGDNGWSGKVELTRPKKTMFRSDALFEEPAGRLLVSAWWDFEPAATPKRPPKERTFPSVTLFTLKERQCWGHETFILTNKDGAVMPLNETLQRNLLTGEGYDVHIGRLRLVSVKKGRGSGINEGAECWKINVVRFTEFLRRCGRETPFKQECRMSLLRRRSSLKGLCKQLLVKMERDEQSAQLRGRPASTPEDTPFSPRSFRVMYRGVRVRVIIRNAVGLPTGGFFGAKINPYAMVKLKGANGDFCTSTLKDGGSDPVWNCQGSLIYNGEMAFLVRVYDYDMYDEDDVIAEGQLPLTEFTTGSWEGMVRLSSPPGMKRSRFGSKPMSIIIGLVFDQPQQADLRSETPSSGGCPAGHWPEASATFYGGA